MLLVFFPDLLYTNIRYINEPTQSAGNKLKGMGRMMKRTHRLSAMFLAALLAVSTLASCGGDGVTVTLTLDDDSTVECAIVGIFDGGDKEYIALLPLDENGQNEDGEVYLYRYSKDTNGQPKLENIESDEEYEIASDAFDELLDSMEYDELVSEDELN